MDKQNTSAAAPDPFALVAKIKTRGPAPVHLWDPPFCGDIDMLIRKDGSWVHEGKAIRRQAMVQLFASVLKREGDKYFLVTPAEKVGIKVEDCPFVVVEMEIENPGPEQILQFTTNTGETVSAGKDHPLSVDNNMANAEPHPILHIRSGLYGLLTRAVFYRLVEAAETQTSTCDAAATEILGVRSGGVFFPLGDQAAE